MADSGATFTLTFKTLGELTGLNGLLGGVRNAATQVEQINTRIRGIASTANTALATLGLGLGLRELNEYGKKALEVREQQAGFVQAIMRSRDGSAELVQSLVELNEKLEHTTGTLPGTARAIEQLFARAGVSGEEIAKLTHGVIEFAAGSAGTVQPLELAAVVARRLSGAADATDLSLGRLGIRAKDVGGIIAEMTTKGGTSAETLMRASGGMKEFEIQSEHTQVAIGNFINLLKVPFLTTLTGSLTEAKGKIDDFTKGAQQSGNEALTWGERWAIAAAAVGETLRNIPNIFVVLVQAIRATLNFAEIFELGVVGTVVNAAEALAAHAVDVITGLYKFAANAAKTLSGGVIAIDPSVFDAGAELLKSKMSDLTDSIREKIRGTAESTAQAFDDAMATMRKSLDEMSGNGPKILDPEWIAKVRAQVKSLVGDVQQFGAGLTKGSGVIAPGTGGDDPAKAATDALTQAKFNLSSAEQRYQGELKVTQLLEEHGDITAEEATARRRQSAQDYMVALRQMQAALPALIAQLDKVGDVHGASEARLELQKVNTELLELKINSNDNTFFGGMIAGVRQLAVEWANTAKAISGYLAGTMQTAIGGVSQALTSLIFKTGNWRQAFAQAAQSIVQNLIQIVLQWIIGRTVMAALNKLFGQADTQAANAQASSAAAAWAPAATSASIASYGVAAGVGTAAYLAALGAGTAGAVAASHVGGGASGGFAKGGHTGPGSDTDVAGPVHKNEFVLSAPATRAIGLPFLETLHAAASKGTSFVRHLLGVRGYEGGGEVGEGGEIDPPLLVRDRDGNPYDPEGMISGRSWTGGGGPSVQINPTSPRPPAQRPSVTVSGASPSGSATASGRDAPGVGGSTGVGTFNTAAGGYLAPGVPSTFATAYPTTFTNMGNGQWAARALPADPGSGAYGGLAGLVASGAFSVANGFANSGSFGAGIGMGGSGWGGGPDIKQRKMQFDRGGYTGQGFLAGLLGKIAGIVHPREFVFSAPAVDSLGVGFLTNLHNVALTKPAGYERGGFVGAGGGGSGGAMPGKSPVQIFMFADHRAAMEAYLASDAADKHLVNALERNRYELGL